MKPQPLDKIYISNTVDEEDLLEATDDNKKLFKDCIGEKPLLICKLEDIKSACEFYLRYKDKPALLWKEREEYRRNLIKLDKLEDDYFRFDTDEYNEWLFRLAFRSVIKNETTTT